VTPEPTSITDAYATMKVLATTQQRHRLKLLVNQAQRPGDGRGVLAQLQQVVDKFVSPALPAPLRLDLMGELPSDGAVREAVQKRQLLLECYPGAPAALAVVAAAAKVAA
jgi:flagellar biosynthesis protein FlhG